MKNLKGDCLLFTIGGIGYSLIEILYRHRTHWTMALTGGTCFLSLFKFYKKHSTMKLFSKCLSGSMIITAVEFISGYIINLKCKLNVWDYSNCRFNVKGQICPFYSMLWALLCIPISSLCKLISAKADKIVSK